MPYRELGITIRTRQRWLKNAAEGAVNMDGRKDAERRKLAGALNDHEKREVLQIADRGRMKGKRRLGRSESLGMSRVLSRDCLLSFAEACWRFFENRFLLSTSASSPGKGNVLKPLSCPCSFGSRIRISCIDGRFLFFCLRNPYRPSHVFLWNIPEPAPCRDSDMIFLHCRKYTCRSGERKDKKRRYLDGGTILDSCFSIAPTES